MSPFDDSVIRSSDIASTLDRGEIRDAKAHGALSTVWRGALHQGPVPDDAIERYRLTVIGAALAGTSGRIASNVSAAVLHRVPMLSPDLRRVHFTMPTTGRRGPKIHIHRDDLPPQDITDVDGIRTTTLERTITDVARLSSFEEALCVVDAGLRMGADPDELHHLARACAGMKGVGRLRQVLAAADPHSESVGESFSRALMLRLHLPMPELQVDLYDASGTFLGRADFMWADRVVGEFDGRIKYRGVFGKDPADVLFDEKRREDRIRATGRIVVRWTWEDLLDPPRFRALILHALRMAGLV